MSKKDEIRQLAEQDLKVFARLVGPGQVYGQVHDDFMDWLTRPDALDDQLGLLPRGHRKSHVIAVWCAWWITKHPETTICYVSATEDLAILQLWCIKNILDSSIYRSFWPDMTHVEEGKRAEWNARNIQIDHPRRAALGVRDRTVAARAVGGNTTGLHADVMIFDDLVVPDNAYTELGRASVAASYAQFASIANPGAITKIVGTRYHGKDIYASLLAATYEEFDDEGNIIGEHPLFEVFQREVEEDNVFLWPREMHPKTNKWYGFDIRELAKIRSKYYAAGERAQYHAQYYNNPNSPDENRLSDGSFQYYDRKHLEERNGTWYISGKELSLACAGDLAFTTGARSDYTAYAVVGKTSEGDVYILDMIQFKTDKYNVYYEKLYALFDKWKFRKCRIETNAGANLVVNHIKQEMVKSGAYLGIEGKNSYGDKIERAAIVLEPLYETQKIWHYRGGLTAEFEEQVLLARPAHDDLKDAVSSAIEICTVSKSRHTSAKRGSNILTHERFGGRRLG